MIESEYVAMTFALIGVVWAITVRRLEWLNMEPNGVVAQLTQIPIGNLFLAMFILSAVTVLNAPFGGVSLNPVNISSGTLYTNWNYTFMNIYVVSNTSQVLGWEGSGAANVMVINITNPYVLSLQPGSTSSILRVPYGWDYQFNYTGHPLFYDLNES